MTPERIFALKVDAVVRYILGTIILVACALGLVEVCLAGPSCCPGIPSRIGAVGDPGPGFAPMQRGAVQSVTPGPDYSWVPAGSLSVQLLPGDFVMADATRIAQWNDSSGNNNHASVSVSINQPIVSGTAALFNEQYKIMYLTKDAISLQTAWTAVFWADLYTVTTTSNIKVWMAQGADGFNNVCYSQNAAYYVGGKACPGSGYTRPEGAEKEVFFIGSDGSGSFHESRTFSFTGAAALHAPGVDTWRLGSWAENVFNQFMGCKMRGFWFYRRTLTPAEKQTFKDNLI